MLSKLGSYRQAIPPSVALEHLRKPSIKPSPESKSIFIPANPDSDVKPMDVDVKVVTADSGTDSQDPGTGTADPEATHEGPDSEDPMDIDEPVPLCMIRPPPRWAQIGRASCRERV